MVECVICLPLHGSPTRVPQWQTLLHVHCFSTAHACRVWQGDSPCEHVRRAADARPAALPGPDRGGHSVSAVRAAGHRPTPRRALGERLPAGMLLRAAPLHGWETTRNSRVRSRRPRMPQRAGAVDPVLLWHPAKACARHRLSRNGTGASGRHVQAAADHRMAGWGAWMRQRAPRWRRAREARGRTWRWRSWWSACAARRSRTRRRCAARSPTRPWTTSSSTCPAPSSCCARPGALQALGPCTV